MLCPDMSNIHQEHDAMEHLTGIELPVEQESAELIHGTEDENQTLQVML